MSVTTVLDGHPAKSTFDPNVLTTAIEAALTCAGSCSACADACLHEDDVADRRACIGANLDCADICATTAKVLSRPGPDTSTWRSLLQACIDACTACRDHCRHHGDDHCQACADDCQACIDACTALLEQTS